MIQVKILPNDKGNPPGKLADVELHFVPTDTDKGAAGTLTRVLDAIGSLADAAQNPGAYRGIQRELSALRADFQTVPLAGLKLIGFAVWEIRNGQRRVTFPSRQYSVNGERRAFALLRPIVDVASQDRIRDLILDAYAAFVFEAAEAADARTV